jgi:hypothetical protein
MRMHFEWKLSYVICVSGNRIHNHHYRRHHHHHNHHQQQNVSIFFFGVISFSAIRVMPTYIDTISRLVSDAHSKCSSNLFSCLLLLCGWSIRYSSSSQVPSLHFCSAILHPVTPLRECIFVVSIFLICSSVNIQYSGPYRSIGMTRDLQNCSISYRNRKQ